MKIRSIALLLSLMLLISMFGCVPDNDNTDSDFTAESTTPATTAPQEVDGYNRVDPDVLDFSTDLYQSVKLTKGYDSLDTDAQRACYELIDDNIFYISEEAEGSIYNILPVTVEGVQLSEAQLHLIITAYSMDHPEFFWLENGFSYYSTVSETYLQLSSCMSAEEIESSAHTMYAELREIFSGMPGNLSEYDRELFIHDKLISRCEYADDDLLAEDNSNIYTSLGAIVDSLAVCEGYSRGMQLMLSLVGIESFYVYGTGSNDLHMWNSVKLEDNWYYLDATWNDDEENGSAYDHFNLTTEQILTDHTIAPMYWDLTEEQICGDSSGMAANFNIFVPECTEEKMSYYAQNAVTVTGFDTENIDRIAGAIAEAAENGDEAVYLYIDQYYLDYDYAIDNLFYSGDYAIFTCIEKANSALADVTVSDDYVSTSDSPTLSVVTVYLEYE